MNVIAIIPARYGSTRLDGKPLLDIGGKPMVQWVYERAKKAKLIRDVMVATDDKRVMSAVERFGGKAVMTSSSHRSGTDRIAEAAKKLQGARGKGQGAKHKIQDTDIIVNVQGDEPLIEPEMIDEAIKPLLAESSLLISTLKTRITNEEELKDPNVVKVVTDREGFAIYFSRLPIPYVREQMQEARSKMQESSAFSLQPSASHYKHIGLYVYRKDFLLKFAKMKPTPLEDAEKLEQLRVLENGYKIKVVETKYNSVGVDTQEDLEKVRKIVERGQE